jgi:peptidyl-prolyl cis-trans isomerase B (cyclophilin B)
MKLKTLTLALSVGIALYGCGGGQSNKKEPEKQKAADAETETKTDSARVEETPTTKLKAVISTSEGDIVVQLYDETPLHRDNFVKLAKEGFYEGTIFHRVIKDFMIQGGDPESKNPKPDGIYGSGGPGYTVPAEIKPQFFHKKGALSAARQGDNVNPEKKSSGSQFYIVQGNKYPLEVLQDLEKQKQRTNPDFKFSEEAIQAYTTVGGTPHLDGDYTVYGEVVEGLDTVDKIAGGPTGPRDRPAKDVVMQSVTIESR